MTHMSAGYESDNGHSMLHTVAYVAFQELGHPRSHRKTPPLGRPGLRPHAGADRDRRELHMVFYEPHGRGLRARPDLMMQAVRDVVVNFQMPGTGMPASERAAAQMAIGEIYNMRIHHDDVISPIPALAQVLSIDGLSPRGSRRRKSLGLYMNGLNSKRAVRQSWRPEGADGARAAG